MCHGINFKAPATWFAKLARFWYVAANIHLIYLR